MTKQGRQQKISASEMFAQRKAQSVNPRSDKLSDSVTSQSALTEDSSINSDVNQSKGDPALSLQSLQHELDALPKVTNFQLRFEDDLKGEVKDFAREQGVTPETLLQGLWTVIQRDHPDLMSKAIDEARIHKGRRSKAAELKNSITRLSKLLESL